ncbi:MAG: ABC transporter permease [Planctomycetales bacterium]|nr:ABC transporter permease [Planctomycetales bacterium]
MNRSLAFRTLWWNDLRQLTPVAAVLVVLTLALHVISLISANDPLQTSNWQVLLLLGLPGLFAVGAGALLVGHEKETRTIRWLSTLPIARGDLIRAKLLSSVVGLILMWLISLGLAAVFSAGEIFRAEMPWNGTGDATAAPTWILHSTYLLLAGLALAWRMQSPIVGMLTLVPVATIPLLVAGTVCYAFGNSRDLISPSPAILLACQLLSIAGVIWWGARAALADLGPAKPYRIPQHVSEQLIAPTQSLGAPKLPFAALLWQVTRQNRATLLGCGCLLAIAIMLASAHAGHPGRAKPDNELALATFVCFVASSWLGVSVFQGDKRHNRISFLADRGLPPLPVWLSRQLPPAALLITAALVGAVVIAVNTSRANYSFELLVEILLLALMSFSGFIFSQWTSQWTSSPIVSAVVGPGVSIAAAAYLSFAFTTLAAPIWLLTICAMFPLFATIILMRRWMDCKHDRIFWAGQTAWLVGLTLVPTIPLMVTLGTTESMSRETRAELMAVVQQTQFTSALIQPTELMLTTKQTANEGLEGENHLSPKDAFQTAKDALRNQLTSSDGAVQVNPRIFDFLRFEISMARMRLTGDPAQQPDRAQTIANYNELLRITLQIARRGRLSYRLIDQDGADLLEIALLTELDHAGSSATIEPNVSREIMDTLRDSTSRHRARRQAIALSWSQWSQGKQFRQYGGYYLPDHDGSFSWQQSLAEFRRAELMVQTLWQLNDASVGKNEELRRQLAEYWRVAPIRYGLGPDGNSLVAHDPSQFFLEMRMYPSAPATQWRAGWERQR